MSEKKETEREGKREYEYEREDKAKKYNNLDVLLFFQRASFKFEFFICPQLVKNIFLLSDVTLLTFKKV